MIDVEGLAAFLAVAEASSFSRAADRLGVAQSVVSKRLKRLEDQLGASLVDRTVRTRIALTPVGANYMAEARTTLNQLAKAERICLPVMLSGIRALALSGQISGRVTPVS